MPIIGNGFGQVLGITLFTGDDSAVTAQGLEAADKAIITPQKLSLGDARLITTQIGMFVSVTYLREAILLVSIQASPTRFRRSNQQL